MASFNSVTLMGNLTRDPELKTTQGGMQICTIGLAVSRKWFDKASNATKEDVLFVDCTAFGRTAEIAGEYLAKGKPVHLQGRLKLDQWEDKTSGQKRQKITVVIESLQLIGTKGDSGGSRGENQDADDSAKSYYDNKPDQKEDQRQFPEDEVPF